VGGSLFKGLSASGAEFVESFGQPIGSGPVGRSRWQAPHLPVIAVAATCQGSVLVERLPEQSQCIHCWLVLTTPRGAASVNGCGKFGFNCCMTSQQPPAPKLPFWRRREFVTAALIAVSVIVVGIVVTTMVLNRQSTAPPSVVTLPLGSLGLPQDVDVDAEGSVYAADLRLVLKLPPGSASPVRLPLDRVGSVHHIDVAPNGDLYIADGDEHRVLRLRAGATEFEVLPFEKKQVPSPRGVAVGADGTVYVVDSYRNHVLALPDGSEDATVLPFVGLRKPQDITVNSDGVVYVVDSGNNRVVALEPGADSPSRLDLTGLRNPMGIAVDSGGNVYVADSANDRVFMVSDVGTATVLPFTGLDIPVGVAVDRSGNVYVADANNKRVLRMSAALRERASPLPIR
jgi:serine/threonine-protein kinase